VRLAEDQRLQDIAALGVIALVLAGVAIFHLATRESTRATAATPIVPTKVLGEHIERPPTTVATAPKPAPKPATPASVPASSVRSSPVAPKQPPVTHLVTVTSNLDCGPGGATGHVALSTLRAGSLGAYVSDGTITISNSLRSPIHIDNLVVKIDFADGTSDTIPVADASGITIGAGADDSFHTSLNTQKQPTAAAIATLDFHVTGGQPCTGRIQ
jgi:hypothetical protein